MSEPNWDDLHTPEQWADRLDEIAEHVAHAYGEYSIHSELKHAAECLRHVIKERDDYRLAGAKLVKQVLASTGIESMP